MFVFGNNAIRLKADKVVIKITNKFWRRRMNNFILKKPLFGVPLSLMLVAMTPVSFLVSTSATAQDLIIEEIVVTARKREESLQDVPVAITAMTETMLLEAGIDELGEV